MALSAPRVTFGIHSVSPYSRTDGTPYGIMKVLDGSSLKLEGELIELKGGSNKYNWAAEDGNISSDLSIKVKQFDDFLFTLFLGATPTANAAETSGSVTTLTNKKGTSVMHATTGIASATVLTGSEANLKFNKFVVVAVSSTTVDVYALSDADFGRGTNGSYTTDGLKVAAAQTITASTATDFTTYGFKLTGGSGTIGMTTGDSATFSVRPVNTGSMDVTIGSVADQIFPEWGAIIMAQKRGNQELFEIDAFKCKAVGMPLDFQMNAFNATELKAKLLYDSTADGLFSIRHVKPS